MAGCRRHLDQFQLACENAGPGIESAELVVDRCGRVAPLNRAFALFDLRRDGRGSVILRSFPCRPVRAARAARASAPMMERRAASDGVRSSGPISVVSIAQHRPVIELLIDAHDRHAGRCFAALDGALNRRRAAVLRKDRAVDVEESARGNREQRRRQNLSVRDDDAGIGSSAAIESRNSASRIFAGCASGSPSYAPSPQSPAPASSSPVQQACPAARQRAQCHARAPVVPATAIGELGSTEKDESQGGDCMLLGSLRPGSSPTPNACRQRARLRVVGMRGEIVARPA